MWRWWAVLVVLVATSCATSAETEEGFLTSPSEDVALPEGWRSDGLSLPAGGTYRQMTYPEFRSSGMDLGSDVDGTLEFTGCRWRAPGLYTLEFEWAADIEAGEPAQLVFQHEVFGFENSLAVAAVTMPTSGSFSLPFDGYASRSVGQPEAKPTVTGERSTLVREQEGGCVAKLSETPMPLPVQVDAFEAEAGSPGSLDELVAGIAATSDDAPLLPLATFRAQSLDFTIDRLFVSTEHQLTSWSVSERRNCLTVWMNYVVGNDDVRVIQTLRCPVSEQLEAWGVVVADDIWRVVVAGPPPARDLLVATIEDRPIDGIAPLESGDGVYDPTAALEAEIVEQDFNELLRVPWDDGLVSIGHYGGEVPIERYSDPLVATPEEFLRGGSGQSCRSHTIVKKGDDTRGFAFVVLEDPSLKVVVRRRGEEIELEAVPVRGGRAVAFVSTTGLGPDEQGSPAVRLPDGSPAPCDQTE